MTALKTEQNIGRITQIIGPVIDAVFHQTRCQTSTTQL